MNCLQGRPVSAAVREAMREIAIDQPARSSIVPAQVTHIDAVLAEAQRTTRRALAAALFVPGAFDCWSDLELACAYSRSGGDLHDAIYCELHGRHITPWKIAFLLPALDATPLSEL